jgi:hypothetical protein
MEKVALLCLLIAIISLLAELSPRTDTQRSRRVRKPFRFGPFK